MGTESFENKLKLRDVERARPEPHGGWSDSPGVMFKQSVKPPFVGKYKFCTRMIKVTSCAPPACPLLPLYDNPDLVGPSSSFFVSFYPRSLSLSLPSVLHNIGFILFGPPAYTFVDTDRPP